MKYFLATTFFFLIALSAQASSPTIGTVVTYDTEGGAITSKTISYTTTAGSNKMLVIGVVNISTTDITSATWNGSAMTALTDWRQTPNGLNSYTDGRWFYILNPDIGTYNAVVNFGSTGLIKIGIFELTNAVQGAPHLDIQATWTSGTTHTHNYTTTINNVLVIEMGQGNDVFSSWGAGQTQLWSLTRRFYASYKEQTTAGSSSMAITLAGDSYWDDMIIGVAYQAPPATVIPSQDSDIMMYQ